MNYLDKLIPYLERDKWEDSPSAAISAISALGDYLYDHKDPKVLRSLMDAYELDIELYDKGLINYNLEHAKSVYYAINTSLVGREALLDAIRFRFPRDVNLEVIERAYKNLDEWA